MAGSVAPVIKVQAADFDVAAETKALVGDDRSIGALVTFTGLCRDEAGQLVALHLEHYPGMAETKLHDIAVLAIERFDLNGLTLIHRFGRIETGEQIVLVIAASTHRQAAFDGANFVMDYLKTEAPFWKKEEATDGTTRDWVSAKDEDDSARERWQSI